MSNQSFFDRKLLTSLSIAAIFCFASSTAFAEIATEKQLKNNGAPRGFTTPSGNISCLLEYNDSLRCEIKSRLNPMPSQPYNGYCEFDWGYGFRLSGGGRSEVLCISDTIGQSNYILKYGSVWRNGDFECVSQSTGLTCTNAEGRGFFLSRNSWEAF